MSFGIEAASYYVPSLYLEIKDLAEKRGIEPAKLEKGLGLHKMGLSDVHEDAATFAAEALLRLIKDYNISPKEIARVYLGTESAVDAAKTHCILCCANGRKSVGRRIWRKKF